MIEITSDWTFFRKMDLSEMELYCLLGLRATKAKDGKSVFSSDYIGLMFPQWAGPSENVLFVEPHDDDGPLAGSLLTQAVIAYEGTPYFLVVTDGRNGYWAEKDKGPIYDRRLDEKISASEILGVPRERIIRLDLPDGNLAHHLVTTYEDGSPGLIMRLTEVMRRIRATRVVVPSGDDAHPDHFYVNRAVRICVFNAGRQIWEELGEPHPVRTTLESQVYSGLSSPDVYLSCNPKFLAKKMAAIAAFASQTQIQSLVDVIKAGGPYEFFSDYRPESKPAKLVIEQHF